jgi:hypothetical protein
MLLQDYFVGLHMFSSLRFFAVRKNPTGYLQA